MYNAIPVRTIIIHRNKKNGVVYFRCLVCVQGAAKSFQHLKCNFSIKIVYTVGHKEGAIFIFTITLANVDRFQ